MFVNDELISIIEDGDALVAEIRELSSEGPHFRILHRFHRPGSCCARGEEVAGVYLVHQSREFWAKLSLALRMHFDHLAHSRRSQSATQIEAGIRADRFDSHRRASAMGREDSTRTMPRSFVRVYIQRLRLALERAFDEASLLMDSRMVVLSQETVMNDVGYRLRATLEWAHPDF